MAAMGMNNKQSFTIINILISVHNYEVQYRIQKVIGTVRSNKTTLQS